MFVFYIQNHPAIGVPPFLETSIWLFYDFIWGLYNVNFMFFQMGFINRVYDPEVLWGLYGRKDIGLNIIGCIIIMMIIIVYECLRYVLRGCLG